MESPYDTPANPDIVFDYHTLYIQARGNTPDDIDAALKRWVSAPAVQDALHTARASSTYYAHYPTDREETFMGFAYVYCVSTALFHLLLGRQASGDAGVWVTKPSPDRGALSKPSDSLSWADMMEEDATDVLVLEPRPPVVATDDDPTIIVSAARVDTSKQTHVLRTKVSGDVDVHTVWHIASQFVPSEIPFHVLMTPYRDELVIVFPPTTFHANFAAFFLRKRSCPTASLTSATTSLNFWPVRATAYYTRPKLRSLVHQGYILYPNDL
jgi:hypothetical protein